MKIVDDTIIWAATEAELEERVSTVLQRCAENNITISRKKFEMGTIIHFAGHIISDGGIRPDDDKFTADLRPKKECGFSIIKLRSGTSKPRSYRADTTAGYTS